MIDNGFFYEILDSMDKGRRKKNENTADDIKKDPMENPIQVRFKHNTLFAEAPFDEVSEISLEEAP
jgi:hypothetical protein